MQRSIRSRFRTLGDAYLFFDTDHSGYVDKEEIKGAIRVFGVPYVPDNVLDRIVVLCDTDVKDGQINFTEFIAHLADAHKDTSGDVFVEQEHWTDHRPTNASSNLNMTATRAGNALNDHLYTHFTNVHDAFLKFDKKRTGFISQTEFRNMLGKKSYEPPCSEHDLSVHSILM